MRPRGSSELLTHRRVTAVHRVIIDGEPIGEVAEQVGVHRNTLGNWVKIARDGGEAALQVRTPPGRPARLDAKQVADIVRHVLKGPKACGFPTGLWTLPRIAMLIEQRHGIRYDPDHLSRLMGQWNISWQKPRKQPVERDQAVIDQWIATEWPRIKKVRTLKATLIFLDETGFSLIPHVAKTWGLVGKTPVLKCRGRHRQRISAIVAVTVSPKARRLGLLFRTHLNSAIDQHRVLGFIKDLMTHRRGPIVLVMDNINTHKSKLLKAYLNQHPRLHVHYLPPYAPELNPTEWHFEDAKCHELANHGLLEINELRKRVQGHIRKTNANPKKIRGYLQSAKLPWRI